MYFGGDKVVCYHPLKAFPIGITAKGKTDNRITGYTVDHVELINGKWLECPSDRVSPYAKKVVRDFIRIPCGNCIGCRLDYSRQWADRCMLEMKYHESSYFLTLTYNDDFLPRNEVIDPDTGMPSKIPTLCKRDFQLFMKRLRRLYSNKFENKLRFFACGEYGSHTYRPHYHAIIFGLKLNDLVFYKRQNGFNYYTSEFVQSCWREEKTKEHSKENPPRDYGFVVIAKACWETCAYTARYIMKKAKGQDAQIYKDFCFEPEFTLMSRKPGLARQYFDENSDKIFNTDFVSISTPDGGKNIYPPRYFRRLLENVDPDKFLEIREKGLVTSDNLYYAKSMRTSQSYLDMLATEEDALSNRIQILKRKDV